MLENDLSALIATSSNYFSAIVIFSGLTFVLPMWSSFQLYDSIPLPVLLLFEIQHWRIPPHEMPCFHELCNISVKSRRPPYRRRRRQSKGEPTRSETP